MSTTATHYSESRGTAIKEPKRDNYFWSVVVGILTGILLAKSEAVSWYRIHEMFLFQSIHMYGLMGSAVVVGAISIGILKKLQARTLGGVTVEIESKDWKKGYAQIFGGIMFGLGWGLLGACPGPIYVLLGSGISVMIVALFSALTGVWVYGYLRPKLPH